MMAEDPVIHLFRSIERFCHRLYKVVSQECDNVYLSPFILHATIAMVYEGVSGDSQKELELALQLEAPEITTNAYRAIFNNLLDIDDVYMYLHAKIYVQDKYRIKEAYKKLLAEDFLSEIESINFVNNVHAAQIINAWVARNTLTKIMDIVASNDFNTLSRLILINAAYFTGQWQYRFDPRNTKVEQFRLNDVATVECDMMSLCGHIYYLENKELNAEIVKLPFTNGLFSLMVLLPKTLNGLEHLERQIPNVPFTELIDNMDNSQNVNVCLPKFRIEKRYDLTSSLRRVGFRNVYSTLAQFQNMVEQDGISITKIIQKTTIRVYESGVHAASTTGEARRHDEAAATSVPTRHFIANHPFMFAMILKYETSYCPIFIGKVYKP